MMNKDLDMERNHLARADRAITDSSYRIAEQEDRIARLQKHGHDVTAFTATLKDFEKTLEQQISFRTLVVQRIGQIKAELSNRT